MPITRDRRTGCSRGALCCENAKGGIKSIGKQTVDAGENKREGGVLKKKMLYYGNKESKQMYAKLVQWPPGYSLEF